MMPPPSIEPTDKTFPPPPLRERALSMAVSKIGQAELPGRPNQGPIVDWSIRPWTPAAAGPWAMWCAGFVSTCYAEALPPAEWREIGSLSCDTLWHRCSARGWTHRAAEVLPAGVLPGDLVFFTHGGDPSNAQGLRHVGLVEKIDGRTLCTIEGNAGDMVRRRTYDLSNPQIYGFAHIPW